MKRIGGLFNQIATRPNLSGAAYRAATGKRDKHEVCLFFRDLDDELAGMETSIANGSYTFAPYTRFSIRDPKSRTIHAPSFRDRVMHHALISVTGPVFERGASAASFACRAGRGQHEALKLAKRYAATFPYYGKIDIKSYYASISHERLRQRLQGRFRESRLLGLWDRLLSSFEATSNHGLAIGALTSQYLGNFFLDPIDHSVRTFGKTVGYVRYMDDMLIFGDRTQVGIVKHTVYELLAQMDLVAKHGGEWNECRYGVPFLGFVIYPDRMRLNRQGRKRLRRKFKTLSPTPIGDCGEADLGTQANATALFAHAQTGDDLAWRRYLIEIVGRFGDTLERPSRAARRVLEQQGGQLPLCHSQQEQAVEPQQEQRLPRGAVPRHGDATGGMPRSPDVAYSRAPTACRGVETSSKSPVAPDIPAVSAAHKAVRRTDAPGQSGEGGHGE